MKKLSAIFFLIIYTSPALGAAINFHYCSGRLSHISVLNFGSNTGCSCNPKDMPKACCKDKLLYSKVDNHKTIQASYTFKIILFTPDLPPVNELHNLVLHRDRYDSDNFYSYIRRSSPQPIYLLIRLFRI